MIMVNLEGVMDGGGACSSLAWARVLSEIMTPVAFVRESVGQ